MTKKIREIAAHLESIKIPVHTISFSIGSLSDSFKDLGVDPMFSQSVKKIEITDIYDDRLSYLDQAISNIKEIFPNFQTISLSFNSCNLGHIAELWSIKPSE